MYEPIRGRLTCHPSGGLRGEAGLIAPEEEEPEDEGVWSVTYGAWSGVGDDGGAGTETEI